MVLEWLGKYRKRLSFHDDENNKWSNALYNLQVDMSRRQLEYELQCLHELMQKELGTAQQIAQRHDARILRIRTIDNHMLRLQQQYREQLKSEQEKRDSGTCEDLDPEQDGLVVTEQDGVVVLDACTNTNRQAADSYASRTDEGPTVAPPSYLYLGNNAPTAGLHGNTGVNNTTNSDDVAVAAGVDVIGGGGPAADALVTCATQTPDAYLPPDVVHNTNVEAETRGGGGVVDNSSTPSVLYHGGWQLENHGGVVGQQQQDTASVMSFTSSNAASHRHPRSSSSSAASHNQQLGTKVEMVYSLLSMLGTHDKDDMSRTLLAMSSSDDSCLAMRQSGCLPLLIQLLHGCDSDTGGLLGGGGAGAGRGSTAARARAAAALHNVVHSHPDDKRGRREARVLRLLEQIRAHCDQLREEAEAAEDGNRKMADGKTDIDHHPGPAIAALMKWSFDEEHRHAICTLGGLQAIAELLQVDHETHGAATTAQYNVTMRRYACMALTNLTFGDGTNKAQLCSMRAAMRALVAQLASPNEDLRQVAASVLRNLSWRADLASKKTLREVDSVVALMQAAMEVKKESTLKSILSALWNLSAHCSENKADVCAVDGALAFLVSTLLYKSPSQTLAIIENGGGILRNVSSHIAVREDYRKVLRQHNCLQILLKHLRSPSLTIVSNACGTLWNISARCPEDQKALWELGAVSMLKNLVHSKHKMISMGSAAALKNLLSARPTLGLENDRFANPNKPGLHIRKQRALEAEIDQNLAETCENMESPTSSPTEVRKHDPHRNKYIYSSESCGVYQVSESAEMRRSQTRGYGHYTGRQSSSVDTSPLGDSNKHFPRGSVSRSASQDSVGSVHSDISHDRTRLMLAKSNKLLQDRHNNANFERHHHSSSSSGGGGGGGGNSTTTTSTSQHRQSDASSDRSSTHSGSRIVKVMQEVVQHAEEPPGNKQKRGSSYQDTQSRGDYAYRHHSMDERDSHNTQQQQQQQQHDRLNNSLPTDPHTVQLTTLNNRMENLHLSMDGEDEGDDQPINYSIKYQETPTHTPPKQKPANSGGSHFAAAKPVPKVDNYMGGMKYSAKNAPKTSESSFTSKPNTSTMNSSVINTSSMNTSVVNTSGLNASSSSNRSGNKGQHYGQQGYSEATDYDNENTDQPTNYSMRYAEEHEDDQECSDDQPINFSSRFQDEEASERPQDSSCADCKLVQARRTNEMLEQTETEDTVRTFCTEGTPLNFMSTTTSMTDLSAVGKGSDTKGESQAADGVNNDEHSSEDEVKDYSAACGESEHLSGTDSHSTDHNTGSTVVYHKQIEQSNIQNNNIVNGKPVEKAASSSGSSSSRHEANLQSIDENDYLDTSSQNVTLKADMSGGAQTPGAQPRMQQQQQHTPGKTVTFDDNNQVQETPLMFSRCSSLGSLSSFDAHSVHSSVMSEYSRRTSGAVSPSDLPDSPSDTMPSTPSRKSPVRNLEEQPKHAPKFPVRPQLQQLQHQTPKNLPPVNPPQVKIFSETPQNYATEGSPGDFSSGTSLSALTFDDEPHIEKEDLTRIPLGEDDGMSARLSDLNKSKGSQESPEQEETILEEEEEEDDDSDNSEVSEGEENLLAEFINLGMPTASSKPKKMRRSNSDGQMKKDLDQTPTNKPSRLPQPSTPNKSLNSTYTSTLVNTPKMKASYSTPSALTHLDMYEDGYDSPKKFATEGTPINFSTATSISDLSTLDFGDKSPQKQEPAQKEANMSKEDEDVDDDKSDVSSLASDDNEDLLSEAIEAAMPNYTSKKPKAGAQESKLPPKSAIPTASSSHRFQYQGMRKAAPAQQQRFEAPRPAPHMADPHHQGDTVMTFAVEGTPINFSRATSPFSELNAGEDDDNHPEDTMDDDEHFLPPPPQSYPDSPRVYGMEGTPISYSRNDSLSDLSCEDDADIDKNDLGKVSKVPLSPTKQLTVKGTPVGKLSPNAKSPRRTGIQSPAIARLKTPTKSFKHEPSMHSTPVQGKQPVTGPVTGLQTPPSEDAPRVYAVEGTPYCFSRNSSLSSLDSDDHEGLANSSGGSNPTIADPTNPKDASVAYRVEDTPANLSGSSPLSNLSVESLSFEPTLEESALLEECINAAMPKSAKGKKKKERVHKTSPNVQRVSPRQPDFSETSEQPKNVSRPQAEINARKTSATSSSSSSTSRSAVNEESSISEPAKTEYSSSSGEEKPVQVSLHKQQKEANNQEKQHDDATSSDAEKTSTADMFDLDEDNMQDIEIDAYKLAETFQELENKFAELGMTDEKKDLCLEAEHAKQNIPRHRIKPLPMTESMTKSAKALARLSADVDMQSTESLGCRPLPSDSETEGTDILQESFPDLSSSLVSNLTTPDFDKLPSLQSSSDNVLSSSGHGPSPLATSDYVPNENKEQMKDELDNTDVTVTVEVETDQDDTIEGNMIYGAVEITAEEQRALEENANIIVSELSATQHHDLSSELLDPQLLEGNGDDLLLEDEMISLVSNDEASDQEDEVTSEASFALSEEQASEISSRTLSPELQHSPPPQQKPRPRIVKPGQGSVQKEEQKEEEPKGIRGKRKLLYRSPNAAKTVTPAKKEAAKPIRAGVTPPKKAPAAKPPNPPLRKTPVKSSPGNKTPQAKNPPKPPVRTTPVSTPGHNTPPARGTAPPKPQTSSTAKASPKYGISVALKQSPSRQATGKSSGIPKPSPTRSVAEKPKLQSEQTVIERPPPPIKQGTFTKDEPTVDEAPTIEPGKVTDMNGNRNRDSQRSSDIPTPSRLPQQQQRASLRANDSEASPSKLQKPTTAVTGIRKPSPVKSLAKPSPTKATAAVKGTTRPKTAPAPATTPTRGSSTLNKSGNNNSNAGAKPKQSSSSDSLSGKPRTPSRSASLQRDDSQTSLNRASSGPGSRSSTPTRKSSTGSTAAAAGGISSQAYAKKSASLPVGSSPAMMKPHSKHAVSKIASLWKREPKKSVEEKESKGQKTKSKLGLGKKSGKETKSAKKTSMTKSSTYDKLEDVPKELSVAPEPEPEQPEPVREPEPEPDALPEAPSTPRAMWRRTYTISNEDVYRNIEVIGDAPMFTGSNPALDKAPNVNSATEAAIASSAIPKAKGLKKPSIFKRATDSDKTKDTKAKQDKPEKKRFSLFKRGDSEKRRNKTSQGFVKGENGVWVRMDGTIVEDNNGENTSPEENTGTMTIVADMESPPAPSPASRSPLTSPSKSQPSAIVPPFNYKPTMTQRSLSQPAAPSSTNTHPETSSEPTEPPQMTKTEMLLERRRRRSVLKSTGGGSTAGSGSEASLQDEDNANKKSSCLVTTV